MHEMSDLAHSPGPIFYLNAELWTCMRAWDEAGIDVYSNVHEDWGLQSGGRDDGG